MDRQNERRAQQAGCEVSDACLLLSATNSPLRKAFRVCQGGKDACVDHWTEYRSSAWGRKGEGLTRFREEGGCGNVAVLGCQMRQCAAAMLARDQARHEDTRDISVLVSASVFTGITCFIYAEHAWVAEPCATAKAGTLPMRGFHMGRCRTLIIRGESKRRPQTCTCLTGLQVGAS